MKRMIFGILGLAGIATGTIAAATEGSGVLRRTEWYSDSSLTVQTGEFVEFCDGSFTMNGQPEPYSKLYEYAC